MEDVIVRAAERLGYEAARVWPQIVLVTWAHAVWYFAANAMVFVVGLALLLRAYKRIDWDSPHPNAHVAIAALAGLAVFIAGGNLLFGGGERFAALLAPEAVTVLNIAKGLK
jgi:hypothetical protein